MPEQVLCCKVVAGSSKMERLGRGTSIRFGRHSMKVLIADDLGSLKNCCNLKMTHSTDKLVV